MHIAIQTEYSFKNCYGKITDILDKIQGMGHTYAGIADLGNTFGHPSWEKECLKREIVPVFGVRLNVVKSGSKQRRCDTPHCIVAINQSGLEEMYKLVEKSYRDFYYIPRITFEDIEDLRGCIVYNYYQIPLNRYINAEDYPLYQVIAGASKRGDGYNYMFQNSTVPRHLLTTAELEYYPDYTNDFKFFFDAEDTSKVRLPKAGMVICDDDRDIDILCATGAKEKGIDLEDPIYKARLKREIDLIKDKEYTDYFLITADMIEFAKKTMLVGPSRGSSAGSLVCYLLSITEVDPIPYGLIFERFIDVNRFDLPDIDIDFPDDKRHLVVEYLSNKYGEDKVRTLANVSRFHPKSAFEAVRKIIGIQKYELEDVKSVIIERMGGDERANLCVLDTLETTQQGKDIVEKYPNLALTAEIEGHASHSGKHAAGVIVSTLPLSRYGSVNPRDDVIQLDKTDATYLNLLKIDCLGLRTLTILQQASELAGFHFSEFYKMPLDDEDTFAIFNDQRLSGIFQFEGHSLQGLVKEITVTQFSDIAVMTALGRPGPLNSGGASLYCKIHSGQEQVKYLSQHKSVIDNTKETLGIIVYQEQLMAIAREYGNMSWHEVSELRRGASKTAGEQFFSGFKTSFINGAKDNGASDEEAEFVWESILTFGSWGFNKSHAVSYGFVSYWTAYMKAHHPLEFYTASLNNSKDEKSAIYLLRDLVKNEGVEYIALDPVHSKEKWSIQNGKLVGGLTNIKGVAEKKAKSIMKTRELGKAYTPAIAKLMKTPVTPYDEIFPCNAFFGHIKQDWKKYGFKKPLNSIKEINLDNGKVVFIGRLERANLRDLNEHNLLEKRGYIIENNVNFLMMTMEDDEDSISCSISRMNFQKLNAIDIAENGIIGESWYLISGKSHSEWRMVIVDEIYNIDEWKKEK